MSGRVFNVFGSDYEFLGLRNGKSLGEVEIYLALGRQRRKVRAIYELISSYPLFTLLTPLHLDNILKSAYKYDTVHTSGNYPNNDIPPRVD